MDGLGGADRGDHMSRLYNQVCLAGLSKEDSDAVHAELMALPRRSEPLTVTVTSDSTAILERVNQDGALLVLQLDDDDAAVGELYPGRLELAWALKLLGPIRP